VEAYASGMGHLRHVMVAYPRHAALHPSAEPAEAAKAGPPVAVRSVAICAGSGYSVLKDCDADVYVTGEMSHHDALRLTMLGKCVLTVFHSNSERRFLKKRLQPQLEALLRKEVADAEVLVSEEDQDPFEIWDVQKMPPFAYDRV
jgi:putative NIF3 family GTP cyclohydrolase 1 type 2